MMKKGKIVSGNCEEAVEKHLCATNRSFQGTAASLDSYLRRRRK